MCKRFATLHKQHGFYMLARLHDSCTCQSCKCCSFLMCVVASLDSVSRQQPDDCTWDSVAAFWKVTAFCHSDCCLLARKLAATRTPNAPVIFSSESLPMPSCQQARLASLLHFGVRVYRFVHVQDWTICPEVGKTGFIIIKTKFSISIQCIPYA